MFVIYLCFKTEQKKSPENVQPLKTIIKIFVCQQTLEFVDQITQ